MRKVLRRVGIVVGIIGLFAAFVAATINPSHWILALITMLLVIVGGAFLLGKW